MRPVVSGYDLDKPNEEQRRGEHLSARRGSRRRRPHGAHGHHHQHGAPRAPGRRGRGPLRRPALRSDQRHHAPRRARGRCRPRLRAALRCTSRRRGDDVRRGRLATRRRRPSGASSATPARPSSCTCTRVPAACATGSTPGRCPRICGPSASTRWSPIRATSRRCGHLACPRRAATRRDASPSRGVTGSAKRSRLRSPVASRFQTTARAPARRRPSLATAAVPHTA